MKLIFVYNANSGKLNLYKDIAHKIFSPQTYPCSLCAITFGVLKENEHWKTFRKGSDLKMEFHHIDEFNSKYRSKWLKKFEFPVILNENNEDLEVFISKDELDALEDSEALIHLIQDRVTDQ
ncbi:MAG: GTPase [Leeuwenhoekiella sp.]